MTNIDFNEGNRLIAEFMNLGKISENIYVVFIPEISSETLFLPLEQLRFEQKWDWLIPVVVKCKEDGNYQSYTHYKPIEIMLCSLDITNVYETVIEFIQWHNSQNNP